jgi:hypothetical protein
MAVSIINGVISYPVGSFSIASYNLHGLNQGMSLLHDLCECRTDAILIQEHWQTPANISTISNFHPNYVGFGISAMDAKISSGILVGRPFGGVSILINNTHKQHCTVISCAARFVIIRLYDCVIVNLYLPCLPDTIDNISQTMEVLELITMELSNIAYSQLIIAGDFNNDLKCNSPATNLINAFLLKYKLYSSARIAKSVFDHTYHHVSLNQQSYIDYIFVDNSIALKVDSCVSTEGCLNLSDHEGVIVTVNNSAIVSHSHVNLANASGKRQPNTISHLRWDKGNLTDFYVSTGVGISAINNDINYCTGLAFVNSLVYNDLNYSKWLVSDDISALELMYLTNRVKTDLIDCINRNYESLVNILSESASATIPVVKKNFFKFWWGEELKILKSTAVNSHNEWLTAGKPRSGIIYDIRTRDKYKYKMAIKNQQLTEMGSLSNDLQDSLLTKNNDQFWKTWNSKVKKAAPVKIVDNCIDDNLTANNFASYFADACQSNSIQQNNALNSEFDLAYSTYVGDCMDTCIPVNVELVSNIVDKMQCGKGAGMDGLVVEHLKYAHPLVHVVLSKLFRLMLVTGHVPVPFGIGLTIPIPKGDLHGKSVSVSDYRGITISPVVSKVFENCLLKKFGGYLHSSSHQFGFKKNVGCNHAIYAIRKTIDHFTSNGSTVNVCSLDLSKAFDKVNHYSLFIKLMNVKIPRNFIEILKDWSCNVSTCVRWECTYSNFVKLNCGVRQGGVLSPFLFAIVVDDIIVDLSSKKLGCHISQICCGVFLYADDIILLSISLSELQTMVNVCLTRLNIIDMKVNPNKSSCLRIGNRYDKPCAVVSTPLGAIPWVVEMKYLGVTFQTGTKLKINLDLNKAKYYRNLNGILGKLGLKGQCSVMLALIDSHCTPCLLYGIAAFTLSKAELLSVEHPYSRAYMKIFQTFDQDVVRSCQYYSGYLNIEHKLALLKRGFLCSITSRSNTTMSRELHDVLLKRNHYSELDNLDKLYNILSTDSYATIKTKVWAVFASSLK